MKCNYMMKLETAFRSDIWYMCACTLLCLYVTFWHATEALLFHINSKR